MTDSYLYSVTNHVATFSINDAPWNLMSLQYIDRLEEQLPDVLADDSIRAMVFTGEGLDHFSAGMNLKQLPEGMKRAGGPAAFFGQRHKVLDMIENGGTPAIATLFGYCLGGGPRVAAGLSFPDRCQRGGSDRVAGDGLRQRACMGWFGSTSSGCGKNLCARYDFKR